MTERRPCPPHYAAGGIELADVLDAFDLGRWEAAAVQYICRAKRKFGGSRELEDIEKALECLERVRSGLRERASGSRTAHG